MFLRLFPVTKTTQSHVSATLISSNISRSSINGIARTNHGVGVGNIVPADRKHGSSRFFSKREYTSDSTLDSKIIKQNDTKYYRIKTIYEAMVDGNDEEAIAVLQQYPNLVDAEYSSLAIVLGEEQLQEKSLLMHAIRLGRVQVAKEMELLRTNPLSDSDITQALGYAIDSPAQFELCAWLVSRNQNYDIPSRPVLRAIQSGSVELVQLFRLYGYELHDEISEQHMLAAIDSGNVQLVKLMCQAVEEEKSSSVYEKCTEECVYRAILGRNLDIVQALYNLEFDVNDHIFKDLTPLMVAVADRNLDMVKKLVEMGADVSATTFSGISVMDCAMLFNNKEIINYIEQLERKEN